MSQRLDVKEDEKAEDVHRRFDDQLGVRFWRVSNAHVPLEGILPEREPGAPDWWYGEEDASSTFLKAQGVIL